MFTIGLLLTVIAGSALVIWLLAALRKKINIYSAGLWLLYSVIGMIGILMLLGQNMTGLLPLGMAIFGIYYGLVTISPSNPKKAGLIVFFGVRTNCAVKGWVLTTKWMPTSMRIVDVSEFVVQSENHDFTVDNLRCQNGVYINGTWSATFTPKMSGLGAFDDAKGLPGIYTQLDDYVVAILEQVAQINDSLWMTGNRVLVASIAKQLLEGTRDPQYTRYQPSSMTNGVNVLAGLGVSMSGMSVDLKPISEKVMHADSHLWVIQRTEAARKLDTDIMLTQAQQLFDADLAAWEASGRPAKHTPSFQDCWDRVYRAQLAFDGRAEYIGGRGGILAGLGNVGGGKKGKGNKSTP
jgi:hypothetical protein